MVAMGLSLAVPQIIAPLRNVRLVILALFANFVLVPLIASVIVRVIPVGEPLRIGLILLATEFYRSECDYHTSGRGNPSTAPAYCASTRQPRQGPHSSC